MKRTISVFLAAAICTAALSLTACSSKTADASSTTSSDTASTSTVTETAEDAADNTQMPNPITEQDSLDAVNEAIGSAMKKPADLELTDESWSTIEDETLPIGQYMFTYNGGHYTLRAAKDTGDISGVWENGTTLGNGREGDVTAITTENGGIWSRWFDGEMQYSLYAEGATMDDYTAVRDAMA